MSDSGAFVFLLIMGALAVLIFARLHRAAISPPPPADAPPGVQAIPLGQYAVQPSRQWLLLQPGQ